MTINKKILLNHLVIFLVVAAILLVYEFTDFGCPINVFLGFDCPTCRITRAVYALLRLDFKGYFAINFMAVPVILSVWFFIHRNLFKYSKQIAYLTLGIVLLNFVLYILDIISINSSWRQIIG